MCPGRPSSGLDHDHACEPCACTYFGVKAKPQVGTFNCNTNAKLFRPPPSTMNPTIMFLTSEQLAIGMLPFKPQDEVNPLLRARLDDIENKLVGQGPQSTFFIQDPRVCLDSWILFKTQEDMYVPISRNEANGDEAEAICRSILETSTRVSFTLKYS